MDLILKSKPLQIGRFSNKYTRRVVFSAESSPFGVTLSTVLDLPQNSNLIQDNLWLLLAKICRAVDQSLSGHLELNYYTFPNKLVWAGEPTKITVIVENSDLSCDMVLMEDAKSIQETEIIRLIKSKRMQTKPKYKLREKVPLLAYFIERITGLDIKRYIGDYGPIFISVLGLDEIDFVSYTPAHSMAIYPLLVSQENKIRLTLCFNHQLANARPIGRFLISIKKNLNNLLE